MSTAATSFREMIRTAQAYLAGDVEFMSLYYTVQNTARDIKWFSTCAALRSVCAEWEQIVERCRNEWGLEADSLTEDQLRVWLAEQLSPGSNQ